MTTVHTNTPELKDKVGVRRGRRVRAAGRSGRGRTSYPSRSGLQEARCAQPFPIHGIDDAIGVPRSILGYIVFGCGLFGLLNAIFMVWYTNGYDYPLVIGGKPSVCLGVLDSANVRVDGSVLGVCAPCSGCWH